MPSFLAEVLQHKQDEIAQRKLAYPLSAFVHQVKSATGRFLEAIDGQGQSMKIIAEIKPRSPVLGNLSDNCQLEERIAIYANNCQAISVLCDQKYFDGSIELLRSVSATVKQPTLCKDFVIDPYQVYEARLAGAEAVLLICKILTEQTLLELSSLIEDLGMSAVVEVQNEAEMEMARRLAARIILINSRNLDTLKIDLNTVKNLSLLAPAGSIVIAASGVENEKDFMDLRPFCSRFLIGSAFMKSADPSLKFDEFFKAERFFQLHKLIGISADSSIPLVKICGICKEDDAAEAVELGANFLGLIFAPSPRQIDISAALRIREKVALAKLIGVFKNQSIEEIIGICNSVLLDAIQLHGDEAPEFCRELASRTSLPIIKAIEITDLTTASLTVERQYLNSVQLFLFDRPKSPQKTMDGESENWLEQVSATYKNELSKFRPFLIAGGLCSTNLSTALILKPDGIDLASGVEKEPGVKDKGKMAEVFAELKRLRKEGSLTC